MRKLIVAGSVLLVLALASPVASSLFVEMPFDEVVGASRLVVRGTVERTWSQWDAGGEIIFTYADVRVSRSLMGTAEAVVTVREVGGTVGDYEQVAIGFPKLREGESVVLFLSPAEDEAVFQIEAYNQGKFLVERDARGQQVLVRDSRTQGHEASAAQDHLLSSAGAGLTIAELESMLGAVVRGREAAHAK